MSDDGAKSSVVSFMLPDPPRLSDSDSDSDIVTRANSLFQMEKVKGREPSTVPTCSNDTTIDSTQVWVSKHGVLMDVALSPAQMKLLGVETRDELYAKFEKLLKGGGCSKGKKTTLEALLDHHVPKTAARMSRINELAKPVRPVAPQKCTFAPKTNCTSKNVMRQCGYDFAHEERAPFVDRLTRNEKQRRDRLARARGKADYDFMDKKVCPKCGAVQSYDEYIDKRKCQDCNVAYKPRRTRGLDAWLDEQEMKERRRRDLLNRHREEPKRHSSDFGAFLERLQRDLDTRKRHARDSKQEDAVPVPVPAAPKKKKTATASFISKWEDDLEEFVRTASTRRQRQVERKRFIAASAAARRAAKTNGL